MATRKTTQKSAEEPKAEEPQATNTEEPQAQEEPQAPSTEEPKAEEPKAQEEEPKDAGKMVLVRNKARFDYVQPSTGIKIYAISSEATKVLEDGWVKAFVDAGLLEYA